MKEKKYMFILLMLYPFVLYSKVYLNYHSIEQVVNGCVVGAIIAGGWFYVCVNYVLKENNAIKGILKGFKVINNMSEDVVFLGGDVFEEDWELEKKYKELLEKNKKLEKLKNDLQVFTKHVKNMEFMKNNGMDMEEIMEGMGLDMGKGKRRSDDNRKAGNTNTDNINIKGRKMNFENNNEEDIEEEEEEEEEHDEECYEEDEEENK